MKIADRLIRLEEAKNQPIHLYSYPIDIKQLKDAYNRFNKELFDNKLPKCRLKFAPLAKNFYGKYHHKYNDDSSCKDRLITIAKMLVQDGMLFENVLIHEMIHCWQYFMEEKTGDDKYLDDLGTSNVMAWITADKDIHKNGHGEYFFQQAKRINKLGYAIHSEDDMQVGKELVKPIYAIILYSDTEKGAFLYAVKDPTKHIDEIISSVEAISGAGFFNAYKIIKTTDTTANIGLRLTKTFELPKNSVNIYYPPEKVYDLLMKSGLSTIISTDTVISQNNDSSLKPEDTQLLQRMHKYRGSDLAGYTRMFLGNSTSYTGKVPYGYKVGDAVEGVSQATFDAIKNDWINATDVELKKPLKYVPTAISIALMSPDKQLRERDAKEIEKIYKKNFEGRASLEKFGELYFKVVVAKFKKDAKKYKKEFNDKDFIEMLKKSMLKNTILGK